MKGGWTRLELGGVPQWISVRGRDPGAPLLLFLHGGPGAPEYATRRKYLRGLEERWLVVDWDQRGAGRSFRGDADPATLSVERLVRDAIELVAWLCREFGRARVVLVGHSFGTVLGVLIAQRIPTQIAAYVGVGQVVNFALQEERGYDWALAEARRRGNTGAVAALERLGRPIEGMYANGRLGLEMERRWLRTLGGVARDPAFVLRWVLSTITCADYPLSAKLCYLRALRRSLDALWPDLCRGIDFMRDAGRLETDVHLFAGRDDHITDAEQIEAWHAALVAPTKRLEVVDGVGHLCLFERPERFVAFVEPLR